MIKAKRSLISHFWTNVADRLRTSLPVDLYTEMSIPQIKQELENYPLEQHYSIETQMTSEGMNFRLSVSQPIWLIMYRVTWIEGRAKPVENMEWIHIQGKVYSRTRYTLLWIGAWFAVIFSLPTSLSFTPTNVLMSMFLLGWCYLFIWLWSGISIAQYDLLEDFEITLNRAARNHQPRTRRNLHEILRNL